MEILIHVGILIKYNIFIQGENQWLIFEFNKICNISYFNLTFQGGFVGSEFDVYVKYENNDDYIFIEQFLSDDNNSKQEYKFNNIINGILEMKLVFTKSSDFYGRITIYEANFF